METVKYFEFNKHDYYALLAVEEENSLDAKSKAIDLYVKYIGGEDIEEISEEGIPDEISKDQALLKFMRGTGNEDETVGKLTKEFNEMKDLPLLVDGSLL